MQHVIVMMPACCCEVAGAASMGAFPRQGNGMEVMPPGAMPSPGSQYGEAGRGSYKGSTPMIRQPRGGPFPS